MKQQEYQGLKIGRTCVDFYIDEFIERFEQERLLKEAEREQEEANHKKYIAAIQKLNVKSISHFGYPSQTYSYCMSRVKLEPIITYEICNKCKGSGKGKWWQKCKKCKGLVFIKQGSVQEESKVLLPIRKLEKFV
ncbi:hypothetical protein WAF17_16530 [Bernardetia sp. ABR2-2B]|uniref:hypothetical protein n=1 Tax=Bernardetia sp. ABR2-2B TaxID=3127472 RepID=UPI0030CD5702